MAPLTHLLLLALVSLLAARALAAPSPLRVLPGAPGRSLDDDDGAAGELADGEDGEDASAEADSTGTRPVAILEHRQELQDDGTFNYAFTADNGLAQNEAFHPDGSRTGSYSYVDPKGETILVKYRADRFGFHVLDGSTIPSTPPHVSAPMAPNAMGQSTKGSAQHVSPSDYGREQGIQGVLDPNYFNFPSSGFGNLKTAATSGGKGGAGVKSIKGGAKGKAGAKGAKSAKAKAAASRARSSASSSMHFLQREARQAFVSDVDGGMVDVDAGGDGQESRVALRAVRAPPGMAAAAANANDVETEGVAASDDGSSDHHAAKYDDGSYDHHAVKYDDGSYEPHAAKYDDGSYEPHAANYDDGSYEPHAAKYDDGSYEPHAAQYDDGSYEKYAKLYDDGSYKYGGSSDAEGDNEGDGHGGHGGHGYP